MALRLLVEGVTLESRFEDAVRAYNYESGFRHEPRLVHVSPVDMYSLQDYGSLPVVSFGMLMTRSDLPRYFFQKILYRNQKRISGGQLEHLKRRSIYFKPTLIRSQDGSLVWLRSDTDI